MLTERTFAGHPACWRGEDLAAGKWWQEIRDSEVVALAEMAEFLALEVGDDWDGLLDFPVAEIPDAGIGPVVERVQQDLTEGKGFVVLRGLPMHRWSRRQAALAYWILGNAIGKPLSNNAAGDLLCDIVDKGIDYQLATARGYDSNAKLSYHCDQCDVVALLCLETAMRGGLSKLVSAMALHDEIGARRPDLLEVLTEPFYFSRLGEVVSGQLPWYRAPVFDYAGGTLNCAAGINHIRKGHEIRGAPPLSDAQREALELVEEVSQSIEFAMDFQPGDIQILNNGLILHTRTAFEDWPQPERRRHLLRMWLGNAELHVGAAYFENWRQGVLPTDGTTRIRPAL